jgi:hypothetical protein
MTDTTTSQPKLTRYTTKEEQDNIAGVQLDPGDVEHFMDLVNKGLISAAGRHDAAVQNDMGLSAEVTVRLSRPVAAGDGQIEEVVGREVVTGRLKASKVFIDPDKAPQVD